MLCCLFSIKILFQMVKAEHPIGHNFHIHIVGMQVTSLNKFKFILIIVDSCSQFLEAILLRNLDSQTIFSLNCYFCAFGIPKQVHFR